LILCLSIFTGISFQNPDGSTVLVIANTTKQPQDVVLNMGSQPDGNTIKAQLAPHSVNTFIVAQK